MKPLLVSLGDPAGIGSEVTQKAIQNIPNHPGIILFGHPQSAPSFPRFDGTILPNEIKIKPVLEEINWPNRPNDPINARIAYTSIIDALTFSQSNPIQGLVTAPISKEGLYLAGYKQTDHTSILSHFFGNATVRMAFYSEPLKVVLATIHQPLTSVETALTKPHLMETIEKTIEFANQIGIKKPKIGIAGLNPHAGENGQFGQFENKILTPMIKEANQSGQLFGPISPDIIFKDAHQKKYDIVIAMYHDQGLIPLKLLAFDTAVNVTIGLPLCRTSPDHGTAYDIANQNKANPSSMQAAIAYALEFGS